MDSSKGSNRTIGYSHWENEWAPFTLCCRIEEGDAPVPKSRTTTYHLSSKQFLPASCSLSVPTGPPSQKFPSPLDRGSRDTYGGSNLATIEEIE